MAVLWLGSMAHTCFERILAQLAFARTHLTSTASLAPPALLCSGSLSSYRASLMLVTLIAILGVDFPAFPRRFAKAETFGTGLMDVGVGSFVAASGLAHGLAAAARAAASGSQRRFPWRRECGRAAALLALGEQQVKQGC